MKPNNAPLFGPALVFLAVLTALSGLATYVVAHGYTNAYAISNWAKTIAITDSNDFRLEYFGLGYPHVPFYALVPFHLIPFLDSPLAPHFVSSAAAAMMMTAAYRDARQYGYSRGWSLALLGVIGMNSLFLWAASAGTQLTISMAIYYWIAKSISEIPGRVNLNAYIKLGLLLAILFFVDGGSIYVVAGLAITVPLLMHQSISDRAPAGFYLIVFMPFGIAALSWVYLNWLFFLDPFYFLKSGDSAFIGAWEVSMYVDWLVRYGGEFFAPLIVGAVIGVVLFPALPYLLYYSARKDYMLQTVIVVLLPPFLATGFSTFTNFSETPYQFLHLLIPGIAATLVFFGRAGKPVGYGVLAMLAVGALLSWPRMEYYPPSKDVAGWSRAVRGETLDFGQEGQVRLGKWLAEHRGPTLLDDNGAYHVIAARGDGNGLILPFMNGFKLNLLYREVRAEFIVLPSPATVTGKKNKVNQRFPDFYEKGMKGYSLAYDEMGWRVYRHTARPA
ncbi:MAG: hypothetical protein HZA04_05370 [Nitrospinae bacterium]|nr:hypothetical protein [Nitrospinota bacterium]